MLEVIDGDKVEILDLDDTGTQLWIKGDMDNDGYFTLKSSESHDFLTDDDAKDLQISGK